MRRALAVVVAALGACASGGREETPRIDSLDSRRVEVRPGEASQIEAERAVESYRDFLSASEDPQLRVEAMRRLADLQLEASDVGRSEAGISMNGMSFAEAVALYLQILEQYPDYAHSDRVLYQLARAYEGNGEPLEALAVLDRLVAEHPHTEQLLEAQFRRGEILFSAGRYGEAERAYAAVLDLGEATHYYEEALYKQGWSLFKQGSHEASLGPFYKLLDRRLLGAETPDGVRALEALSRPERELVEDTLRAMAISYSYAEGPRSIDKDFAARMPAYGFLIYQRLGDLYVAKERYTDAADSYRAFVALESTHPAAPLLQVEAIEAYRRGGFVELVMAGKQEFVERYRITGGFWQRHAREEQPRVIEHLKSHLTDLAQHHHAVAQQSNAAEQYSLAARWYGEYLVAFPDDPQAAEKNFLLAEVLFEAGRHAEAAEQYERTAYAYPFHARSAEAGYAALLAYQRHEASLAGAAREAWHRRGIDGALRFAETFPTHAETAAVLTTAAEKLFELGEYAAAAELGRRVVALEPPVDAAKARTVWSVIAHSEFDLGRYAEAEGAYQALLPLLAGEPAERTAILERLASSVYKQGEQAQAAGDLELAVGHYQRVGAVAPSADARVNADYDAAAALVQIGDWRRAIPALEQFRAVHPGHDFARQATHTLAVAYEETGEAGRAAAELARIADSQVESEQVRREASWRSAELYAEAGDRQGARAQYQRYVAHYPGEFATAMEARLRLADLGGDAGDKAERLRWLQAVVEADATAGASRSERSRYLAATATLELAQPAAQAYRNVRLVAPLEKSLQAKKGLMERALTAYGRAADYGVAEVTTAATYRIAELYHELSRALMDSERPRGLGAEALEQYEILLEEQAFPFEEKAIEIHEANAMRAADGLYDEWVRRSYADLARLVPVRYAKAELHERVVHAID